MPLHFFAKRYPMFPSRFKYRLALNGFPDRTFATADHNTPTINQHLPVADPLSAKQLKALETNAKENGISYWGLGHKKNGIVHVIGPEYGITQPGATIVCGDSHTSTHGAFGAIAFGIGTSEVEMVLATQCIIQPKPKKMRITINGKLNNGVTPKDVALFIISKLTTSGATGYFVEYSGQVFESLSMEGRMTVCNLSIWALRIWALGVWASRIWTLVFSCQFRLTGCW